MVNPKGPALEILCRQAPQPERLALWELHNGKIPEGHRLGETCRVKYCGKLWHMAVVEDKNAGLRDWRAIRESAEKLPLGEAVVLPQVTTRKDIYRAACAIRACSDQRFVFRSLPNFQGVKIVHVGSWRRGVEIQRWIPLLCLTRKSGSRPVPSMGTFNPNSLHRDAIPKYAVCQWKGCPFPAVDVFCRHHARFFEFDLSMTDNALDSSDFFKPWDRSAPYTLVNTTREPSIEKLELSLTRVNQHGVFEGRHR